MTRASERRSLRVHDVVKDLLGESKWTIWCYEEEHMPAMIDILIANGTLSESDQCVHWTAIRGTGGLTDDDLGRVLDADGMLEKAGIRTLTGEQREAVKQGPEAEEALHRKWFGDPNVGDSNAVGERELDAQEPRLRE